MSRTHLVVIVLALAACGVWHVTAQEAAPRREQWEYKFVTERSIRGSLMLKLKKEGVHDFNVKVDGSYTLRPEDMIPLGTHLEGYRTERFDALGKDGWQFCGSIGENSEHYVFRRRK